MARQGKKFLPSILRRKRAYLSVASLPGYSFILELRCASLLCFPHQLKRLKSSCTLKMCLVSVAVLGELSVLFRDSAGVGTAVSEK